MGHVTGGRGEWAVVFVHLVGCCPGGLSRGVRTRVGLHVRRGQAEAPQAPVGSAHAAWPPAGTGADVCRECRPHCLCDG